MDSNEKISMFYGIVLGIFIMGFVMIVFILPNYVKVSEYESIHYKVDALLKELSIERESNTKLRNILGRVPKEDIINIIRQKMEEEEYIDLMSYTFNYGIYNWRSNVCK